MTDTVQRPNRPPPPPAPPPKRILNEDVRFSEVFEWLDKHMEAIDDFMDGDAKIRVEENKKMLSVLNKRKNARKVKEIRTNCKNSKRCV